MAHNTLGTSYFRLSAETKATYKFEECQQDGSLLEYGRQKVGTLYVRKAAIEKVVGAAAPRMVTLTIELTT
jgi:hypothetical protein